MRLVEGGRLLDKPIYLGLNAKSLLVVAALLATAIGDGWANE